MSKIYQWLVVRGKLSVSSEAQYVVLEVDPEDSAYCILSTQDALELAAIIVDEARTLWEASEKLPSEPARVEGNVQMACRIWIENGILEMTANDAKPFIALVFDSGAVCKLDVTRAVAFAQVLRSMADELLRRSSSEPQS